MTTPEAIDIQNPDGTTTVVHQFNPDKEAKTVCIIFPAMGVLASYYQPTAEEMAKQGFIAITADLRGNGFSSIRPSRKVNFSYKDLLDQEYTSIVKAIKAKHPGKKLFLFGHSLGGQLSCLFASRNTEAIDGIILSASCSVYYKGWPGLSAYRILLSTQLIYVIAWVMGYFPGKKVGFGGLEAKRQMADWSRQARTGDYVLRNDPVDYEKELKTVAVPVLAISYESDTYAPFEAVEILINKMSAAKKEHIHLKDADERNEGFSHFNWVKKPKNVVTIISDWTERLP